MGIEFKEIIKFLEKKEIQFEIKGITQDSYHLASLFEPGSNGFYFFTGTQIPSTITDSLFLVNNAIEIGKDSNNAILSIDLDPQMVYYQLLSSLFGVGSNGMIAPTAVIHPEAVIGQNVQIDHYSIIGKVKIGDNVIIKNHCVIQDNTIIGDHVQIEDHSIIGTQGVAWIWNDDQTQKIFQPQLGGVTIGGHSFLGANTIVVRGSINEHTTIGENCLLAPSCRLGHGTKIGNYVHFANNVVTGGNTHIGDNSFIGSAVVFRPKVKLHENTVVGAGAVVVKNTTSKNKLLTGIPAVEQEIKEQLSGMPKPKQ
ncbi:MAG TPA: DapH/DapD/GlmU-related protein [Edaphocola sp.]|nr:DapH/DapD/GlmU-related protein [Edaphocola sp.]